MAIGFLRNSGMDFLKKSNLTPWVQLLFKGGVALCELYRLILDPQVIFCQNYTAISLILKKTKSKKKKKKNSNTLNTRCHACDQSLSNKVFLYRTVVYSEKTIEGYLDSVA